MEKEYLQGVFNYLNEKYNEHYLAKNSQKGIIESQVRSYAKNINTELYTHLNEGSATGLFEPGFFQNDLSRSLKVLKEMLTD